MNVPVGAVGVLLALLLLPRSRNLAPRRAFDWGGLALFVPPVTALLVAISYGNEAGWASRLVLSMLAVALVGTLVFVRKERRAGTPMLDLRPFSRPAFSAGISSGLLSYLVLFGVLFVVPYMLEAGLGVSVARAGLELMVMPLGLGLVAPAAGRLADRVGARPLTAGGMLLAGSMLVVLSVAHSSPVPFLAELALVGVGLGLFIPPNSAAIMAAAPSSDAGLAGGMLNTSRGLGTSLGLALTGLVFGLFAGEQPYLGGGAERGFDAAAVFLAGVALLSALLALFRGQGPAPAEGASRSGVVEASLVQASTQLPGA